MIDMTPKPMAELVGGPRCGERLPHPGRAEIHFALSAEKPSPFARVDAAGVPLPPRPVAISYRRRYADDAALAAIEAGSGDTIKPDYMGPVGKRGADL